MALERNRELPPEYLDPGTPDDVRVYDVRAPRRDDPTVGQPLGPPIGPQPQVPEPPAHRLVTVGDSMTHGVTSGAVFFTDRSWPALVAEVLGQDSFPVPTYGGPIGGLPVNLEGLARRLQDRFGTDLSAFEKIRSPVELRRLLDRNEDYWERGAGGLPPSTDTRYPNLGIYGWDLRDSFAYTTSRASALASMPKRDQFLGAKPERDNDIAAWSVLAPYGVAATQIGAAGQLGVDGGIDTLVVALGANNALDAVVNKDVRWSDSGFDDLDRKGAYNVWRPLHFAQEYGELVRQLEGIAAKRVILATVPHVTVAPLARGVNPANPGAKWRDGSRYFPFYTDPWIDDEDFRPRRHRHLTHQQARAIDSAIDQYNDTIEAAVRDARRRGRNWLLLDLCGILEGLAFRRYHADASTAERNEWKPLDLPDPIAGFDTRFFLSDRTGRLQGGLFGLDGIHPTVSGYGIVAQALLDVLEIDEPGLGRIDFQALLARDTLNDDPPALVKSLFDTIAPFATLFVS